MPIALSPCQPGISGLVMPSPVPRLTIAARAGAEAGKGNSMFGGTLGSTIAIGAFVLVVAVIYTALHLHHRSKTLDRQRDHEERQLYVDARAQRDNLKYQGGVGTMAARPHSPTPNDIT
jgi:hypothetical protein